MDQVASTEVVPRTLAEGKIPLISVEGNAYECGQQYGEIMLRKYPGDCEYLDGSLEWKNLPGKVRKVVEAQAPYLLDLYRGLHESASDRHSAQRTDQDAGCTSFGVSGSVTLDGAPISGQTKDTGPQSAQRYIVLRIRIKDGPTILTLAYPGEVVGYGLWSTGMSMFRNSLYSTAGAEEGFSMTQWGLLALAGSTVDDAVERAEKYGLAGAGNCLLSDGQGQSVSVEFNTGGANFIGAEDGIATHANHPVGSKTAPFEHHPHERNLKDSRDRTHRLRSLLEAERGRITAQKAMTFLADHETYPWGLCNHLHPNRHPTRCTTAGVVAEPTKGKLHVTRGNPCSNWPTTYTI